MEPVPNTAGGGVPKDGCQSEYAGGSSDGRIEVGCIPYDVNRYIEGEFGLGKSEAEVYLASIVALRSDLIAAVAGSSHRMGVSLDDGMVSLEMALRADRSRFSRT